MGYFCFKMISLILHSEILNPIRPLLRIQPNLTGSIFLDHPVYRCQILLLVHSKLEITSWSSTFARETNSIFLAFMMPKVFYDSLSLLRSCIKALIHGRSSWPNKEPFSKSSSSTSHVLILSGWRVQNSGLVSLKKNLYCNGKSTPLTEKFQI